MRSVNIFYSFLIRHFAGALFIFILGFGVFGAPEAATAQGFIPKENLAPEISVTVADRYDPKSLPLNVMRPDNRLLPFDADGMKSIAASLFYYVEGEGVEKSGRPTAVFSQSVVDRLSPALWKAFQGMEREDVVFFQVWGGAARTTGMAFMAGTRIYWRFGLINGMPHESTQVVDPEEGSQESRSVLYWRPASEEKDSAGRASRYFVTDVKTLYKNIYGKVWWKKRSNGEGRDEERKEEENPSLESRHALKNEDESKKELTSPFPATIGMVIRDTPPPPTMEETAVSTIMAPKNQEPVQAHPSPKDIEETKTEKRNVLLARYHEIKKMRNEGSLTLEEYQRQRQALIRGEGVPVAREAVQVAAYAPAAEEFNQPYEEPKGETYKEHPDQFEGFNRAMFKFNDFFYEKLLRPVSTVYSEVTDEDFRSIVANFFRNLAMPVRLVSCLIQGEGEKAGRTLTRFVINTVLTGGMVDVARTEFGMEEVDENFDQALGRHGVGTGPYVVWPVAGPSTVRGTFGMVADTLLKPFWFLGIGTVNFTSLGGGEKVNETALDLEAKEDIDQMSIDSYLSVRDLYFQHTQGKARE